MYMRFIGHVFVSVCVWVCGCACVYLCIFLSVCGCASVCMCTLGASRSENDPHSGQLSGTQR